MIRSLLLVAVAASLASCVAPLPPPPPPPPKPYCPPVKKTTVAVTKPSEPGRFVDGRFIRDTPPDQVEPAKTIRVEKDF